MDPFILQDGYPVDLNKKNEYIYVIFNQQFIDKVKIGRTNNPIRRLAELNTAVPYNYKIYQLWVTDDVVTAERLCHEALKAIRLPRKEFFEVSTSPYEVQYVEDNRECFDLIDELSDLVRYIEHLFRQKGIQFEDTNYC